MTVKKYFFIALFLSIAVILPDTQASQADKIDSIKKEVLQNVDDMQADTQQMVDMIFSFGELGFQEYETSRYLVDILRKNGFEVKENISGLPTAWIATWGKGKPVIALGSDIDCIPKASQKPGVAYHSPIVEGAPGHGEGHNSGKAVTVTAALAIKKIMERDKISGTLVLWPGVAEEQLGAKAYYARDGVFKNADAVLFTHVSSNFSADYGEPRGSGLVSVEYTFKGDAAHAGGSPWRGKSALDAVELMNIGWNFKREHIRLSSRTHYVIPNGGDQPNVVPSLASVWYYHRETDYAHIKELFEISKNIAKGAALMTNTEASWKILGSAWPRHFNKPIALAAYENIKTVGLPEWSKDDQKLAKALQKEMGNKNINGLATELNDAPKPLDSPNMGGGSDDIGDVSWIAPTITLRYPANIPNLPGHHWSNAVAMATPIAHKGSTAGAKVLAATVVDLLLDDNLLKEAKIYFTDVQGKEGKYIPFISKEDMPPIHINKDIMDRYRPDMQKYYYDPTKYKTYLEQLGIKYPTVK